MTKINPNPLLSKRTVVNADPQYDVWYHWCPGCKNIHSIAVGPRKTPDEARWAFDGNLERPTFSPSIKCLGSGQISICHYFIQGGVINYEADCKHDLASKKNVPMEPVPDWVMENDGGTSAN